MAMLENAESRVAFVVGNSAYSGPAALANPVNDAKAVSAALENLGFSVFSGTDLDFDAMVEKFDEFDSHLQSSANAGVALIYYSGHGLQHDDTNYLVPVGAEDSEKTKAGQLIVVQDLVDRITAHSKRRLVILDACRSNPAAIKLTDDLRKTRGFLVDGAPVSADGLAKVTTASNTFLAFSAAPGEVAYDGKGRFSPFTEALLKHIGSVDLPLSNLTVRVRNDVLSATSGRQQTWDESSLTGSFFFNPSSLLLLIGNAIGLAAFISSLIPYSLLLSEGAGVGWIATATAIFLSVLTLFLAGLHKAYSRLRGESDMGEPDSDDQKKLLWQNARKGLIGGVFGGMIAAFLIAVPYRLDWKSNWTELQIPPLGELMTEITIASVFVASSLGALSLIASNWLITKRKGSPELGRRLTINQILVIGAVLGGIAAGILTAPFVTLYFGQLNRPFMTPVLLTPGAIGGTMVIAFTIVNYSLEKFSIARLITSAFSAIKATIISFAFAGIFLGFLYAIGFINFIVGFVTLMYFDQLNIGSSLAPLSLLIGGLIYGVVIGPILGLLIGLTLIWTPENRDPKYQ